MNKIELDDLYINWRSCESEYKKHNLLGQKYSTNYVFDENQTVKWNREKVIEENKKIDNDIAEYKQKFIEQGHIFHKELDTFLLTDPEYGNNRISKEQLKFIKEYASNNFENEVVYFEDGFYTALDVYQNLINLIIDCM